MASGSERAPLLVVAVGNPSRGDDALGPRFVEALSALLAAEVAAGEVELLTDFQLQPEHALDLAGRARVAFVDASVRAAAPFERARVTASAAPSPSTHAMSPEAVLDACRALGDVPEAWLWALRGERFELGEGLSATARAHLDAALASFVAWVRGPDASPVTRRIELEGTVQGVGLRPWICRVARGLGLDGSVRNTPRGVRVEARGPARDLDALVEALQQRAPTTARIRAVRVAAGGDLPPPRGFVIAPSEADGDALLALPPDLATCDDCAGELVDRRARRHGYAFTTCASCGPRFAVARALPYDRARTTMASFAPCAACQREYDDPDDRRFHAQTVACAACGPRVWITDARGVAHPTDDPLAEAAAMLRDGKVLAVQGLGAFHLVCDATDGGVVAELRRRKRRDAQPFAVMVADVPAAEALACLDDDARLALRGAARPIVLVPSRPGALPSAVNGPSHKTGLLLPYTPLHHLLLARAGRPLVVTSGNPSGGPAAIAHEEALASLASIADAFVLHDRPIARRVEDSVIDARGLRVVRRARGLAPTPVRLPSASPTPLVAVGGHQKNTACVVVGDLAYLTPHLGDLGFEASERAWARELDGFEALLGVRPAVVAHDLHPDYATTRYALGREAARRIGVQHHAAHVWAAVAELHLDEPVVGLAFDGTGWGPDGTSWGGECLLVDGARWRRVASLRPIALPGGERCIREVWRTAFAALHDAFGRDEALALARRFAAFDAVPETARATLARMIDAGVSTPRARGLGRWFDALGALALALPRASFDGHVAIAFEACADAGDLRPYPITVPPSLCLDGDFEEAHEVDLRPTLRAAVTDLLAGASASTVAARFHGALVEAAATTAVRALELTGLRRVVLSGGCMQNHLLSEGIVRRLGAGRAVMAREVPLHDGGLSLGQAWAATLALQGEA